MLKLKKVLALGASTAMVALGFTVVGGAGAFVQSASATQTCVSNVSLQDTGLAKYVTVGTGSALVASATSVGANEKFNFCVDNTSGDVYLQGAANSKWVTYSTTNHVLTASAATQTAQTAFSCTQMGGDVELTALNPTFGASPVFTDGTLSNDVRVKSGNLTQTAYASTATCVGPGGLPPGVTLTAIDGGPNYYCSNGFVNACSDGWDSPSFIPIGPWYGTVTQQSDVTRWQDLGWNTAFRTTANTSLSLMKANSLDAIVDDEDATGPETPGMGSETVGLLSADEPSTLAAGVTGPLSTVPNAQQDGKFWYLNNTWNFIAFGGLAPQNSSAAVLSTNVLTPNGSSRHIDTQSVDDYWFSGSVANGGTQGQDIYGLSSSMTTAEQRCGCRYGDMVDFLRSYQTAHPAPIAQFVENGGPYLQDTTPGTYITPPELNWSVWSTLIHGARQIIYFNHTFAGPAQSDDNMAQAYYQTPQGGQVVSMYAQTKATDALVESEAPVLNDSTANGYVTVSPAPSTFSGVETLAKYHGGAFTIFADTRDSESASNVSATFTVADTSATSVSVVGESRSIPVVDGVFSDTFATGATVHIYQVNG